MSTLNFGLMLRQNDPGRSFAEIMQYNRKCIDSATSGFTTLWLEDHFQNGPDASLESFSTLSYLAAQYPQFSVAPLVLGQSYRNPALLAKMAANLHALSGGRFILGIGAGWKEDEYAAYGYPFPSTGTRMDQLEEALQILRTLWYSKQPATFKGKHYQIQDAYCLPQPELALPILVGGGGEKRTLAIVARYADWWNFNSCTVEEYAHKLAILHQHCEHIGRDSAEIKLTYLSTLSVSDDSAKVQHHPSKHYIAGSTSEVLQELRQFQQLGVSHMMFRIPNQETLTHFVKHVAPHFT